MPKHFFRKLLVCYVCVSLAFVSITVRAKYAPASVASKYPWGAPASAPVSEANKSPEGVASKYPWGAPGAPARKGGNAGHPGNPSQQSPRPTIPPRFSPIGDLRPAYYLIPPQHH